MAGLFQARLDGLMGLSRHEGMDIKPTLLRVLADLYVQAPTHAPEERASFTELVLRLSGSVDEATLAAVRERLRNHPDTPDAVRAALGLDAAPVTTAAAAPATHEPSAPTWMPDTQTAPAPLPVATTAAEAEARDEFQTAITDQFFAAAPDERALLLGNLSFVDGPVPTLPAADSDAVASETLARAVLAQDRDTAAAYLARTLALSPTLARRVLDDTTGEAFLVCARLINMPQKLLRRCLLFINPQVGHSVRAVFHLSKLYGEITPLAAATLLACWQGKPLPRRPASRHETLHAPAEARIRAGEARPQVQLTLRPVAARRAEPGRAG